MGEGEGPGVAWGPWPPGGSQPLLRDQGHIHSSPTATPSLDSLPRPTAEGSLPSPPWFLRLLSLHFQEVTSPQFLSTKSSPPFSTQSNATVPKKEKHPHHPAQRWFHTLCAPLFSVFSATVLTLHEGKSCRWRITKVQHSGCTHLMSWLHVGSISSTQQPQEVLWLTVLILWNWGQRVSDLFKATWPVWNTDEPWGAYGVHVMANPKVSWSEGRGMDMLGSSWWCPHVRVPVQGLVVQCSHICLVRDLQITLLVRAEYAMK